jgi:hypothetical protein
MKLISSKKFDKNMAYFAGKATLPILRHNRSAHFISYFESKGNISNTCIIKASQTRGSMHYSEKEWSLVQN